MILATPSQGASAEPVTILLAWVLTVPACMLLGSVLFAASLFVALRLVG